VLLLLLLLLLLPDDDSAVISTSDPVEGPLLSPPTSPSTLHARADCLLQRDIETDGKMPASGCRRLWRLQFASCLLLVALSVIFFCCLNLLQLRLQLLLPHMRCMQCWTFGGYEYCSVGIAAGRQSSQHVPPQMMGLMKVGFVVVDGNFH
jgi:hypothetical protein